MIFNFYNSTVDVTLIAVIVLAVTFAGMLTICTTCEYYDNQYTVLCTSTDAILITDLNIVYMQVFVCVTSSNAARAINTTRVLIMS